MLDYDSDATYCSQAESIESNYLPYRQRRTCVKKSSDLRRSQRISNRSTENKLWKHECEKPQHEKYVEKLRLQNQSRCSTQFCSGSEIVVCSGTTDDAKQSESSVTVKKPCTESIDLMADWESQNFSNEIPLNQYQVVSDMQPTQQERSFDAATTLLTEKSPTSKVQSNVLEGTPADFAIALPKDSKDENSELHIDAQLKREQSKSVHLVDSTTEEREQPLCKVVPLQDHSRNGIKRKNGVDPLPADEGKRQKGNYNTKESPQTTTETFSANKEINSSDEISRLRPQPSRPCKTEAASSKSEAKSVETQPSTEEHKAQSKEVPSTQKKQMDAPKSKRRTSAKTKNAKDFLCVSLSDFSEEEIDYWRPQMTQMNVGCPTRRKNYRSPPPVPPAPLPLLRSVRHSLLPKVYPPNFIFQKPPIEVAEDDAYHVDCNISQTTLGCTAHYKQSLASDSVPQPTFYSAPDTRQFGINAADASTAHGGCAVDAQICTYPLRGNSSNCSPSGFSPLLVDQGSGSSSPSLPDSLKGIFDSDDLREILNVDKVEYRLRESHVKALAVVLEIRPDRLRDVIKSIISLDDTALKEIESVTTAELKKTEDETTLSYI